MLAVASPLVSGVAVPPPTPGTLIGTPPELPVPVPIDDCPQYCVPVLNLRPATPPTAAPHSSVCLQAQGIRRICLCGDA